MKPAALLLLCLIFAAQRLEAQVWAGNPSGLLPNTPDETVHISVFAFTFGQFVEDVTDSLDFDRNGVADAQFVVSGCNTFDCVGGSAMLVSNNVHLEWIADSNHFPIKLTDGQRIDTVHHWESANYAALVSKIAGIGGYMEYGYWRPDPLGFAGFRLCYPADTLYGWAKIQAVAGAQGSASLKVLSWAIQPGSTNAPVVQIAVVPAKPVYCPGDIIQLSAGLTGADQFYWILPDSSSLEALQFQYQLPDSSVQFQLVAQNNTGITTQTIDINVSALELTTEDILLNCNHPTLPPVWATTNVPADIYCLYGGDTLPGPILGGATYQVIAVDSFGCSDQEMLVVEEDFNIPVVTIEVQPHPAGFLLLAQSNIPGTTYVWSINGGSAGATGDSLLVPGEGAYTVQGTSPNGCENQADIILLVRTETLNTGLVQVSPNPFSDGFFVQNWLESPLVAQVFDASGRLLVQNVPIDGTGQTWMDSSKWAPGACFLQVTDVERNRIWVQKLLKQ